MYALDYNSVYSIDKRHSFLSCGVIYRSYACYACIFENFGGREIKIARKDMNGSEWYTKVLYIVMKYSA